MTRNTLIAFILVGIGMAVAIYKAAQPNVGLLKFKVKDNLAYGYGYTDARSVHQVSQFLDENPHVDTLVLGKISGTHDADMNIRLARHIRKLGLNTHLQKGSYIASGGVDLFLAGVERTMDCGAFIGVHAWSIGGARDTIRISPNDIGWDDRQKYHEKFLRDMGIDPGFYAFTRAAAEPEDLHYLTADEIKRFGILTEALECG